MYSKQIIILAGSHGLTGIAARLLEEIGEQITTVEIGDSDFNGVQHSDLMFDDIEKEQVLRVEAKRSYEELGRLLAKSFYNEAEVQRFNRHPTGKGRNKGKRNREWWNK